ncbi:ABC transporter substrate-binding protein [Bosea lathyri]|uniref:Iron complex transport system substrate-binding protein n=1 Tax=Bosea lathyri TaxID=1036778 RepID=A0A1H6D172_9HYPH|nr:ABC transporter substrate-binding protein [Bosea lathyri]SEG79129.1 iron complex transport system substrate-binding protein [Bosea lathyri]
MRPRPGLLSRRALLAGLAFAAAPAFAGADVPGPRVAVLDWVSGQNLLALGIAPVAMPELERYARLVVEPAVPTQMHELGLRSEPNLELVDRLKPDLVLLAPELEPLRERVARIAPVESFDPNGFGRVDLLDHARRASKALAVRLDADQAFEALARSVDDTLSMAAERLHAYDGRPLYVATIIDGRRLLVFGRNSLFQTVLDRFGIENAWIGATSRFGHVTLTADRLAQRPEARLLCVGDSSRASIGALLASPVVTSLSFVRERRIALIPDVLFYGGLPPARRFARLVSHALVPGAG